MIFGVDLSHHKPNFDVDLAKRHGISFVIAKATEGATFRDSWYREYRRRAQAAGLPFAAYHWPLAGNAAEIEYGNIAGQVDRDTPVILDIERGGPSIQMVRYLVTLLQDRGYSVPLLYLPMWHWQEMGKPDLSGLPPLWASHYPDNIVGTLNDEWADVLASYWANYGRNNVVMLQFTSSLAISNYPQGRIDGDAFNGTVDDLRTLFTTGRMPTLEDYMPTATELVTALMAHELYGGYTVRDVFNSLVVGQAGVRTSGGLATTLGHVDTKTGVLVDRPAAQLTDAQVALLSQHLADELQNRGLTGATVPEVKMAVAAVLRAGADRPLA